MAFGLTPDGFNAKRVSDTKPELESSFKSIFGSGINLKSSGPFGQLIGIMAERVGSIWEALEAVYNGYWPATAQGTGVDNALALVGLTRKAATGSIAVLKFYGAVGTIIPPGTQVSRSDDSTVVFDTGANTGTILAGTGTNEVQRLVFSAVPDAGSFALDFDGQVTAAILFSDNAAAVQAALEALSNIGAGNVLVSGSFAAGFDIEFQNALGEADQEQIVVNSNTLEESAVAVSITPSTTTEGILPNIDLEATCTTTGEIDAPSGTLNTLETGPIAGFDSVINPLDAVLGSEIESDAEAKARRDESVANPGNSTIPAIRSKLLQLAGVVAVRMFENVSLVTDPAGRPGKSYEAVVQGGDDDEIGQTLWESKAGGMQNIGTELVIVKDDDGFDQYMRFSRPDPVPIWVEVDLFTNEDFPLDGEDQVEAAILAFGNALNIADDVIVLPAMVCAIGAVPGITDLNIRVGAAAIPADGSQAVSAFINDAGNLRVDFAAPHSRVVNQQITFDNVGGALPTGLAENVVYWIVDVPSPTQLLIALEREGDPILFVDAGSGVTTMFFGGREDNIPIADNERAEFDSSRITASEI